MKRISILGGCLAALVLAGRAIPAVNPPKAHGLEAAVAGLVQHAQAGDTNYFNGFLAAPNPVIAGQLVGMVQRSGMLTNYSERLHASSATTARLDYHYPEKGCHFQVTLSKQGATWHVTGLGLCR
jgi:hypothetical protein